MVKFNIEWRTEQYVKQANKVWYMLVFEGTISWTKEN